ncbi:MAG: DNA recombination protein RmuC [Candidatus Omnitrophica bacterium]|nr:DNA recombination protein RmuC [Candidatus Omnitrophota bacterium]
MTLFVSFLILLLLGTILGVLWRLWRLVGSPLPPEMQETLEKKEEAKLGLLKEEWSKRLSEEIARIWQQVQGQVQTTERSVSQKLQQANDTFSKVTQELGRLQEATRKVEEVGRNVASLQELLRAPKMRGGLGEFFLADLLAQIMPQGSDFYSIQYEFASGERVDAVIRVGNRLVPVDSKFPLEQFRRMGQAVTEEEKGEWRKGLVRDVKQHIDAISEKYIRPAEGTFEFALMYIPAENVYYETIIKEEGIADEKGLFQHAIRRQVIPVSPNSFYAYLQVILQGLRGLTVEQKAKEILSALDRLRREFSGVREDFDLAGKQVRNALTNFEKAQRGLTRFGDRLEVIESPGASPALDRETVKEEGSH